MNNYDRIMIYAILISILFSSWILVYRQQEIQTTLLFPEPDCICNYPEINNTQKDCYTTEEIVEMKEFQYAIREIR